MTTKKEVKARGAEIRRLRKLFQFDLEKLAKLAKISVPMLSQVERGNRKLSAEAQRRLAEVFDAALARQAVKDEVIRRLKAARQEEKKCHLDLYRSGLPEAKARLAAVEAEVKKVFGNESGELDKPLVRVVLESYEREVEQMKADADMWMQASMIFAVGYVESLRAGERGAPLPPPFPPYAELEALHTEALRQLNETGRVTMPDYASKIGKVLEIMSEKEGSKKE